MSKIEIDFESLKYNLYEILNIPSDSTENKIKKAFIKLVKTFHPDKNSELEEDIYYHIILANQILLNKESKKKYDEYLVDRADTFNELKDSFNKTIAKTEPVGSLIESSNTFNTQLDALNKKHGYSDALSNESVMDKFSKVKMNRDINIEKEDIKSNKEFNNIFDSNKVGTIVEYKGAPSELSTYVIGEHYTSLGDIDKLYIEDSVQCSKYSSLDRAFILQPVLPNQPKKTLDDRMKEYNSQTDLIKNMKPTEFSTKKFNEWD